MSVHITTIFIFKVQQLMCDTFLLQHHEQKQAFSFIKHMLHCIHGQKLSDKPRGKIKAKRPSDVFSQLYGVLCRIRFNHRGNPLPLALPASHSLPCFCQTGRESAQMIYLSDNTKYRVQYSLHQHTAFCTAGETIGCKVNGV